MNKLTELQANPSIPSLRISRKMEKQISVVFSEVYFCIQGTIIVFHLVSTVFLSFWLILHKQYGLWLQLLYSICVLPLIPGGKFELPFLMSNSFLCHCLAPIYRSLNWTIRVKWWTGIPSRLHIFISHPKPWIHDILIQDERMKFWVRKESRK